MGLRASRALRQYQDMELQGSIDQASPHRLVQILFERAIFAIAKAKEEMIRNQIALKGRSISHAIAVVSMLNESLNHDKGGKLAGNLAALYEYIMRRLLVANSENSVEILDECASLLRTVKSAWDQISA